jgi:RecA/RadA recombinase
MTKAQNNPVKILFRFYSDLLEQETVETLWAETINEGLGHYKLGSIPFYVPLIAADDIVYAQYDDGEEMLKYIETLKPSGNSNVWIVVIDDDTDIGEIRNIFSEMNCISEALSDRFFAMEVKSTANYLKIKNKLNELKSERIIDYSESCLSEQHQY